MNDDDECISLTDAAKYVQRKYGRKKPHLNTMARWCIVGLRGIKLDSRKAGGQRVTSLPAIHQFFKALAQPTEQRIDTESARRAELELIAEGV